MPVGCDALELMSLTAEEMTCRTQESVRILDLCCGNGIQGIFALQCQSRSPRESFSLISVDINRRAMHFVAANLALNGVCQASVTAYASCGDLFEALSGMQYEGKFDKIICNPPFVSVPSGESAPDTLSPALYAVGGGVDGMGCLRKILRHLYTFLAANPNAIALMVTELPNVEDSSILLQSLLPPSEQKTARIRVLYVEEDVETVEEYSREREAEAGLGIVSTENTGNGRDWAQPMQAAGIRNRALVLISFARCFGAEDASQLHKYSSASEDPSLQQNGEDDDDPADEEDALLRPKGMLFARNALLLPTHRS